jgi:hypothetical protein
MLVLNMTLVKVFSLTVSKKGKIKNVKVVIKSRDLNWAKL